MQQTGFSLIEPLIVETSATSFLSNISMKIRLEPDLI